AVSEDVARKVDAEIKRLLDEAYQAAMTTLEANRDLLERIAEALLERETLDREEIDLLASGEPLPEAKVVRDARAFAQSLRKEKESTPQPGGGFLGPHPQPGPAHG